MKTGGGSIAVIAMTAIINTMTATAQNLSYGADNWYRSDIVTVQPITFQTQNNLTVAGNLFTLTNLSRSANNTPAIVVGHPMGATKEQSANLYATKLAEQGFVTVSLDLPHWGGSQGEPRNGVAPDEYAEAFSAAVDHLGTQVGSVDRERIGALGICGSGSFVISAAKIDARIKAIATSSMYDMGAANRNGLRHSQTVEQRKEVVAQASRSRWSETEGGEIEVSGGTPIVLTSNSTAVDAEFFDFYRTSRGEFTPEGTTPNRTTKPTVTSHVKFLNFYPFNDIDTISPRPLLFVSGDQAHSREFSEDAYANAAEPKELFWVPGAGHVDLYDRVELIPFDKFTDFFRENL
ncbi:hypothetical protein J7T55_000393 [Diaporthe amygdali]|uniref:uncharacterized protein n=1 Tax=Phomopsis amygdali TaxID=1214568 RepID=UPI0022FDEB3B|nr:uncharacterized protein J7T55_000393 [Diaporthe amygdali]KAJ0109468.1 hypothetical protein J7T55_000393 [Diaporthe amygdali]